MIDRTFYGDKLFYGEVIDMFDFYGIWNAIFNVADSFVCIGAALVVCTLIFEIIVDEKNKRAEAQKKAQELNEKMAGVTTAPSNEEIEDIKIVPSEGSEAADEGADDKEASCKGEIPTDIGEDLT